MEESKIELKKSDNSNITKFIEEKMNRKLHN